MHIFCCVGFNLFFGRTVTLYSYIHIFIYSYTQLASSLQSAWILFGLMPYFRQASSSHLLSGAQVEDPRPLGYDAC
jgi:hypothetical protein